MKNLKKKRVLLLIILLIIIIIPTFVLIMINKDTNLSMLKSYSSRILIETLDKEENKKEYVIEINSDDDFMEATLSYLDYPLYISKEGVFYLSGGRYQKIDCHLSYKDTYEIVSNINLKEQEGTFHPTLTKSVANDLLESLFINYHLNSDITSNITIKDNQVKEFSIYLSDVKDFKQVSITITYDKLGENINIKKPIFYKDAIDAASKKILQIIE